MEITWGSDTNAHVAIGSMSTGRPGVLHLRQLLSGDREILIESNVPVIMKDDLRTNLREYMVPIMLGDTYAPTPIMPDVVPCLQCE